jgi:hypothetical protein
MVMSHSRGHEIIYTDKWRYADDNSIYDDSRPCIRCGMFPTKDGYDACLGEVPGATSACCGHGMEKGFIV